MAATAAAKVAEVREITRYGLATLAESVTQSILLVFGTCVTYVWS